VGRHAVEIEYGPSRVKCRRCGSASVEMLAWAEPYQRQIRANVVHARATVKKRLWGAVSIPVFLLGALGGLVFLAMFAGACVQYALSG
jgi:hypothetical protein